MDLHRQEGTSRVARVSATRRVNSSLARRGAREARDRGGGGVVDESGGDGSFSNVLDSALHGSTTKFFNAFETPFAKQPSTG